MVGTSNQDANVTKVAFHILKIPLLCRLQGIWSLMRDILGVAGPGAVVDKAGEFVDYFQIAPRIMIGQHLDQESLKITNIYLFGKYLPCSWLPT